MLFIFDVDGTIIDNLQEFVDCINGIVKTGGYSAFSREQIRAVIGFGCEYTMASLLPDIDTSQQKKLAQKYRARVKLIQHETKALFDGAMDVLSELSALAQQTRGSAHPVKLALLSNKEHDATLIVAEKALGSLSFDVILGAEKARRPKPHPDGILEIVERCGATLVDTWMIGDTTVDVQAGSAAGVKTVACTWGFHRREDLEAACPTHIVDTWGELGTLLLQAINKG